MAFNHSSKYFRPESTNISSFYLIINEKILVEFYIVISTLFLIIFVRIS